MPWRTPEVPIALPPAQVEALRPERRRPARAALLAGVVVVAALGAFGVWRHLDRPTTEPAAYPSSWDPRIATLASWTEQERGLQFDHPVFVDFIPEEEYAAAVTERDALTEEEREEVERFVGLFRALGDVEGDFDLLEATDTFAGDATVGLYDPTTKRITVRGDELTTALRVTLVHELTHVLQDQSFGLDRIDDDLSGPAAAFRALVEADATRLEEAYVASLPKQERDDYTEESEGEAEEVDLTGVPPILIESFSFPYVFGPTFLDAVVDANGEGGIDGAFRDPPSTEEHIIDRGGWLAGDSPRLVDVPALAEGEEQQGEPSDFGMLSWLLVLDDRVGFERALAAVEGWAGDSSIQFLRDGKSCIRAVTAFDTAADRNEFASALDVWTDGIPGSTFRTVSDGVELTSCDPGASADPSGVLPPDGELSPTFTYVQLRMELIASNEAAGASHELSVCSTDRLIAGLGAARLLELLQITDPFAPELAAVQDAAFTAGMGCADELGA